MSMKIESVLILDGVDKVCETVLNAAGINTTTHAKLSKEQLIQQLSVHDAVIVRSATKVTADVLTSTCRLKVIGRAGSGVDNIDVDAATKMGILVMNTPGGNTLSAAEHTCAMICSLSRFLPQACASLKQGSWDRKKYMGNELFNKTLGIIGLGRIGREIAHRMQAFGMTVVGYDPFFPAEAAEALGIKFLELEQIWPIVDYITVHTPLIPSTRNLIGESTLKLCKPTVKIVNVARGGIVDEDAVLKALNNGTCGGVALDVFEPEPPTNLTLLQHPKVICTPHLGASTEEAQTRVALEIAEQFVDMSCGRCLNGVVNAPALSLAGSPKASPWIELVSSLAKLLLQLSSSETGDTNITLELHGKEACEMKDLLIPAAQSGMLSNLTIEKPVNLVNAPTLAKEMGIYVKVVTHPDSSTSLVKGDISSVKFNFTRGKSTHTLIGVLAVNNPTLFELDDHKWTSGITLKQNLVFYRSVVNAVGPIVQSLNEFPILDLLSSTTNQAGTIYVVRTKEIVQNIPKLAEANVIAQVSL